MELTNEFAATPDTILDGGDLLGHGDVRGIEHLRYEYFDGIERRRQ